MLNETQQQRIREEAEKKYDEFFGTGYWEEQYKKHIVEFTKQFAEEYQERINGLVEALEFWENNYGNISECRERGQAAIDTYNKTINNAGVR